MSVTYDREDIYFKIDSLVLDGSQLCHFTTYKMKLNSLPYIPCDEFYRYMIGMRFVKNLIKKGIAIISFTDAENNNFKTIDVFAHEYISAARQLDLEYIDAMYFDSKYM